MSRILGLISTGVLMTGLAMAQTSGGTGSGSTSTSGTSDTTHRTDRNDNGFNLGWLGLIGLAGLMPRKQKVDHHDRVATDRPSTNRA